MGPFIATFFIALFVLLMQFIWVYVDDMVGKGAGFGLVLEIIFYNSISLIPWALPIAILISSVMLMGNLGERYELASLKSAGISLIRVIRPMLYFTIGVTIFSFFSSNNLVPIANLQFKSRLHDIRTQKPTLNLEEGVFNEDFKGFIIHIGKKESDDRTIRDVIIYDHQDYNRGKFSMITAESGEMYMTSDNAYFVMNLKNGHHYQEGDKAAKKDEKEKYTFTRTKFDEWKKVFDTDEFNIDMTDRERFSRHYSMLSVRQLFTAVDSIDNRIGSYNNRLDEYVQKAFFPLKKKFLEKRKKENAEKLKEQKALAKEKREKRKLEEAKKKEKKDTSANKNNLTKTKNTTLPKKVKKETKKAANKNTPAKKKPTKPKRINKKKSSKKSKAKAQRERDKVTQRKMSEEKRKEAEKRKAEKLKKEKSLTQVLKQNLDKPLKDFDNFYSTFPESERARFNLKERAKTTSRGILNQAEAIQRSIRPKKESRVKHVFVLYSKFTFALVCCVFLFIGAPMGAIVRKGGFGYPLLIAILFFMMFIVLNILFQKLAESFVIPAEIAVWCPLLVLTPISYILTTRALKDKKILNFDKYTAKVVSAFKFLQNKITKSTSNS